MKERQFDTNGLFEHYKNQMFKMLGLFESKDQNGYKMGIRIKSELEHLPSQFEELYDNYVFNVVIAKVDIIIDELLLLDGEHWFIKNHVFETINLLEEIKESLQ